MGMTAEKRAQDVIGRNVRKARGETTQQAMSAASGIPQSVISRVENGEYTMTIELVLRFALATNSAPSELLEGLDNVAVIARHEAGMAVA